MRFALALSLLAPLLCPASPSAEELLIDGIAAQVSTDIVLVSEVMDLVAPQERELRAQNAPEQHILQVRADALETMIEWRLLEQMVKQTELFATEAEIDTTIEAIAAENNLTLGQLKRSVVTQGMVWDSYRQEIKRELERRKIINAVIAGKVQIDDGEIEAMYASRFEDQPEGGTKVHLRQILAVGGEAGSGATVEEACKLVRKARNSITTDREFSEFAMRFSAVAPEKGGDLGWMHTDQLSSYMREIVAPLEPGQLSEVKELPIGCTVVQLVERRDFRPVSFEETEEALRAELYETRLMTEYREWMEELRSHTFIERRGYFADAAQFAPDEESASEFETGLGSGSVLGGGAGEGRDTP
ncbi:MAG: peptidylprolyl isomerase [Deltaproteobacteria bacterium]|nr:peptidylprolyl isomerase [Deltaproteobacteria bacterium]MBW2360839.1 peptidylprolyl isomerase [Deltaproteobacteria bacterium]